MFKVAQLRFQNNKNKCETKSKVLWLKMAQNKPKRPDKMKDIKL